MTNLRKRFGIKNKCYACNFTTRKNCGKEWTQNHWFETYVDVNTHSKAGIGEFRFQCNERGF